jgi:malonate transporter and related proteins
VSLVVVLKLVAVFTVIGIGWGAGKTGVLGPDAAGTLAAAAFGLFVPALLFRTAARIALGDLPRVMLASYFGPTLALMLAVYAWQLARRPPAPPIPAVRALSMSFSNTVQLGIPVVSALFGSAGLALLIAIISLQSLVLLTTATVLAEAGLAAGRRAVPGERVTAWAALATTARRALVHPVVLPILLGLAYHATGLPIPGPVDDVLTTLGQAVVPVSLVTIGLTLQRYGFAGAARQAVPLAVGKLLLQPAVVLAVGYWVGGLRGLPLTIAVLCAALPIGSNVLLFAQRYEVLQAETTTAIVASTAGFLVTAGLWLTVLAH